MRCTYDFETDWKDSTCRGFRYSHGSGIVSKVHSPFQTTSFSRYGCFVADVPLHQFTIASSTVNSTFETCVGELHVSNPPSMCVFEGSQYLGLRNRVDSNFRKVCSISQDNVSSCRRAIELAGTFSFLSSLFLLLIGVRFTTKISPVQTSNNDPRGD